MDKKHRYRYCSRFGQIAVELEFITKKQLQEGLTEQVNDDIVHKPHRLLSEILFDNGWITRGQILKVLHKLSKVEEELKGIRRR